MIRVWDLGVRGFRFLRPSDFKFRGSKVRVLWVGFKVSGFNGSG